MAGTMVHYEFLPLCDVLFNIISLASYFCDIVFDLVMGYALLQRGRLMWFAVTVGFVLFSLMVSQAVSLRWYLRALGAKIEDKGGKMSPVKKVMSFLVVMLHVFQCGVLWRYFKLFVPVDLRFVKYDVRDLCMLRLVHAFCESAPLLLVQLYILMNEPDPSREFRDLNIISMSLSLFSVCWALASFSKNVRMHNVHKLVLTWLGVIFQLAWRLGTVSCRCLCLTAYASVYSHWLLLVILLHWVSMFLWLVSPNNLFHKEKLSKTRKTFLCALVAFVYVFAYINLQQLHHRHKMALFYVVMSIENLVLMYSWYSSSTSERSLPLVTLLLFLSGLVFMLLYYRYFHVRRLKYEAGGRLSNSNTLSAPPPINKECGENGILSKGVENQRLPQRCIPQQQVQPSSKSNRYRYCGGVGGHCGVIPGVFNCRFSNPYGMRKKKKPTSFVPPPSMEATPPPSAQQQTPQQTTLVPFWCRPVSSQSSENGACIDIQEKLEGKKRQQLAELRSLEEEMIRSKIAAAAHRDSDSPILLAPHQYLTRGGDDDGKPVSGPVVPPYTLPRQSRLTPRVTSKMHRPMRSPHNYTAPANSSDGDVDSADDDSECWHTTIPHLPFRLQQTRVKHETKL